MIPSPIPSEVDIIVKLMGEMMSENQWDMLDTPFRYMNHPG